MRNARYERSNVNASNKRFENYGRFYLYFIVCVLYFEKKKKCSDKQKIADEKNIVRMAKELERTKESMKLTEEDLFKVRTINRAIKDKLHAVEDRALMEEEGLKVSIRRNSL